MIVAGMPHAFLDEDQVSRVEQFITIPAISLLVAYYNKNFGFFVGHKIPSFPVKHLCYFIKISGTNEITSENFLKQVHYGTVKGGHIESLLRLMMGIYAPIFFEFSWPNSILPVEFVFVFFFMFFFFLNRSTRNIFCLMNCVLKLVGTFLLLTKMRGADKLRNKCYGINLIYHGWGC